MEIEVLSETIENLVVFGGAAAPLELRPWLVSCGVAQIAPGQTQWMIPKLSYLHSVLPAKDRRDLIRKTVIRDPHYRLHLDISIARVLQIIASGGRWARFDELAFGVLRPLSQRLLHLLEWAGEIGMQGSLGEADWGQFERDVCRDAYPHFQLWDNDLWGFARDAANLFPLLEDLYLPLNDQPVHFNLSGRKAELMASLIEAARADDGVMVGVDDTAACDELKRAGAPIVRRPGAQLCWLAGRVELSVDDIDLPKTQVAQIRAVPLGIPLLAKRSRTRFNAKEISWLKSSVPRVWISEATFLSVCPVSESWPATPVVDAPAWSLVPDSGALAESALPGKVPALEDAIITLDRHPLYGLMLQLFIAEALDRELGDERILLSPPMDEAGAGAEQGTAILYRPQAMPEAGFSSQSVGYLDLGTFDTVLEQIAYHLHLHTLPLPYSKEGYGLWSWALHLLIDLKVVVGQRDRWTLNAALHDRLYRGSLMAKVFRDRRETRQSVHKLLNRLWQDASVAAIEALQKQEAIA